MGKKKIAIIGEVPDQEKKKLAPRRPKADEGKKPVPEKIEQKLQEKKKEEVKKSTKEKKEDQPATGQPKTEKPKEKKPTEKPVPPKKEEKSPAKRDRPLDEKKPEPKPSKPKEGKKKIRSKKYQENKELIDKEKLYDLAEAVPLAKKVSYSKFDGSIEAHIRLNIDLEKSEEQIRTIIKFPKLLGKKPKILAFTTKKTEALKAGALHAGKEEFIEKISKGWIDFNLVIAEPSFMPKLGKIAKNLGTKGMMPNPKTGTISEDISAKIKEILGGAVEVKNDTGGIIHQVIGSVKDKDETLISNFQILFEGIQKAKAKSIKKDFIRSIHLAPSIGPSVKVDPTTINK